MAMPGKYKIARNRKTMDEIRYIKNLGTGAFRKGSRNRAELLRGYIRAAKRRQNWDGIDRGEVLWVACQELSDCLNQP